MAAQRPIPDIYVMWHPRCTVGADLALRIFKWLRPGDGIGPDIYYRSTPGPEAPVDGLPLPLPGESRAASQPAETATGPSTRVNMQIVILLIDEHMIADAKWRYWLGQIAQVSDKRYPRVFLPVALDFTAFNVPRPISERNFLRPAGLPLPAEDGAGYAAAMEIVSRSLLKQLTEALCWYMLLPFDADAWAHGPTGDVDGIQPKISLFLSHAKIDGAVPARRIRDYIYSQTQLAVFYDENDIPYGSAFAQVLQSSVQASRTAALIAVESARYAGRPWCRRELALFRKPVRESGDSHAVERWRLNPVVVVGALTAGVQTAGIPEVGNATQIGWAAEQEGLEEKIVTLALRDVVLFAFNSALGASIGGSAGQIVINWLPDVATLLHIPRVRNSGEEVEIVYPGKGLSILELETLDELFPHVTFASYDRVLQ